MVNENVIQNAQTGYPQQPSPQAPPQQPRQPMQPQQPQPAQPQPSQYAQYQQQVQQAAAYRQYQQQMQQRASQQQAAQSQYAQQQQVQQTMTPQQQPDSGHHKMLVIAAVLVILFAGLGTYLTMMSGGEPDLQYYPSEDMTSTASEDVSDLEPVSMNLMINKLVFADMVYDDFTYDENPTQTYILGEPIYLYIEPIGFELLKNEGDDIFGLDIVEDLIVTGPYENRISYLSVPEVIRLTSTTTERVAIRNILRLKDSADEGPYTVTVILKDMLTGQMTSMSRMFEMIKLPDELI